MSRGTRLLNWPKIIIGLLLFWFFLPAPLTLLESFHARLPPGILDGDDDDDAIVSLSALPSSLPIVNVPGQRVALSETVGSYPSVVGLATASRAPPLQV